MVIDFPFPAINSDHLVVALLLGKRIEQETQNEIDLVIS